MRSKGLFLPGVLAAQLFGFGFNIEDCDMHPHAVPFLLIQLGGGAVIDIAAEAEFIPCPGQCSLLACCRINEIAHIEELVD
jgi:hypothetical protein